MNIAWDLMGELEISPCWVPHSIPTRRGHCEFHSATDISSGAVSFQSRAYFNTHGWVTWQVVDEDNCLGMDGTDYCHLPPRQGSVAFSVKGRIDVVGQRVQLPNWILAWTRPQSAGKWMGMTAFQWNFLYGHWDWNFYMSWNILLNFFPTIWRCENHA